MIDPKECGVVVVSETGQYTPSLTLWLSEMGFPQIKPCTDQCRSIAMVYNRAVKKYALGMKGVDHFIICDDDLVIDRDKIAPFRECDADVACVEKEVKGGAEFWKDPRAFCLGMHYVSRRVLSNIEPPWHDFIYRDDGCDALDFCLYFKRKVLAAGYSIGHAGWVDHTPSPIREGH